MPLPAGRRRTVNRKMLCIMGKDSLAQIAPAETAIGPPSTPSTPTATACRLVDASVSANTRRVYACAGQVGHPEGRNEAEDRAADDAPGVRQLFR